MKRKEAVVITVLFALFFSGLTIASLLLPKASFSPLENRSLQTPPVLTAESVSSGSFMQEAENYVSDHIALRDLWVKLQAWCERLSGKKEVGGVYLGTDGETLFAQFTPAEDLARRVGHVNTLSQNLSVPVYFSLIPDKSYSWAERLPEGAPLVDTGAMAEEARALCSAKTRWVELYGTLSGEDAYYRLDHHWTTMGAYQGYLTLQTAMTGTATRLDSEPQLVSDSFYGTTYSSAAASWIARPDSIYLWAPETDVSVTTLGANGTPVSGVMYDRSKLEVKDKYAVFLGGNQPLCVLKNARASGGRLLVIRDSYSDSLAPFLAMDYQEVHLMDLRYNRSSIRQYVQDNRIDTVLVLYSAYNFATDGNLFLLDT